MNKNAQFSTSGKGCEDWLDLDVSCCLRRPQLLFARPGGVQLVASFLECWLCVRPLLGILTDGQFE